MKVLMVCLGNICRSPLAHGVLEQMAKEKGLHWEVESAGTGDWHIGQAPDHRSIAVAKKYGVDISKQAGCQFVQEDFDKYDRIYVMDRMNLRDVLKLSRGPQDAEKVQLFLDEEIVPDPYRDDEQFEPVYRMIKEGCEAILERELQK